MAQQFGQTAAQDGHAMAPNQTQFMLSRRIAPLHEADIDAEPLKLRASNVEIAAPGARGTVMLKAPVDNIPETKRAPAIVEQDARLVETGEELYEGTIKRNRELHEKLSAIEQRGVHWEARARAERAAAFVACSRRALGARARASPADRRIRVSSRKRRPSCAQRLRSATRGTSSCSSTSRTTSTRRARRRRRT